MLHFPLPTRSLFLGIAPTLLLLAAPGLQAAGLDDDGENLCRDHDTVIVSRVKYVDDIVSHPGETYPLIFNDSSVSGIQGTVHLDTYHVDHVAFPIATLPLPPNLITTSFSSKSEGSLHRSRDGQYLTYMGYAGATPGAEGVSNSYDSADTAGQGASNSNGPYYNRAVARVRWTGAVDVFPQANAYSGDNPRGAVSVDGSQFYMVGNSDNSAPLLSGGTGPSPTIGVRFDTAGNPLSTQLVVLPATAGTSASKAVKWNNFRGIALDGDTLLVSKGSGSNGLDGVFAVFANPATGVLPVPPAANNAIVPLFDHLASDPANPYYSFGIFVATEDTIYVADEGLVTVDASGNPILDAAGNVQTTPLAGLQKWHLDAAGTWSLLYTIQDGLELGELKTLGSYPVPSATYGLRNLDGAVDGDGSVVIYAISAQFSSISGGEPDPTKLVVVRDQLHATSLATTGHLDHFRTLAISGAGEVFRGVSLPPQPAFVHGHW